MNKCEKCGFMHYRTDPCRVRAGAVSVKHETFGVVGAVPVNAPKQDRNKSRHRPGYFTEYMWAYRARKNRVGDV